MMNIKAKKRSLFRLELGESRVDIAVLELRGRQMSADKTIRIQHNTSILRNAFGNDITFLYTKKEPDYH